MRMPRIAALALLVLSLGVLTACGGTELASDPAQVLQDAKLPPEGPNASTLKATINPAQAEAGTGEDGGLGALLNGPITIEASTEGDAATGVTGDAKIAASAANITVAFRADANNTWLQVGDQWYEVGQPLGIDFGGLAGTVGDLNGLIENPKATAVEDIDGVECDRISGTIKPGAALADQLGELGENLPLDLRSLQTGNAQASVWVSRDDSVIRRIQLDTAGEDGASEGSVVLDLTIVPAEPVTVTAPEGAKPITDLLVSLLGDQLGDLGGLLGGLGEFDLGELGGMLTGANA